MVSWKLAAETKESLPKSVFTQYEEIESEGKKPSENSGFENITTGSENESIVISPLFHREMFRTDI